MITARSKRSFLHIARFLLPMLAACSVYPQGENAVEWAGLLELLTEPLERAEIDVHQSLNAREFSRRIERPRLGGFPDLPSGRLPSSQEILQWETSYGEGQIAGLAMLICDGCSHPLSDAEFLTQWLVSGHQNRGFLSYAPVTEEQVIQISKAASDAGIFTKNFMGVEPEIAAELFATVGVRLGLDSQAARSAKSQVAEIDLLGKRVRRNRNSVFRESDRQWGRGTSKSEPSNFVKESLGDEFTQSTIREVIVPGGVALGETAKIRLGISALKYLDQTLLLVDQNGKQWKLPDQDSKVMKSLFDFVQRSEQLKSDAIVDIDGDGRVRISSSLRDTNAGWEIMHADTQPFKFVRNLNVTKSVIIDTFVRWSAADDSQLSFDSEYEVRFLSADNMRIAQTRAALVYDYDAQSKLSRYKESWGRDAGRLKENLDTSGLANSLSKVADYSGWVALFRLVMENDVRFLEGRYQFMKIDTAGLETPARY
ncbi:MAG: hypothetical protein AB8B95_05220 [Pseudohongiellaceae bacterium]